MRFGQLILSVIAGMAIVAGAASAATAPALTGKVVGPDGAPLEGVVVSAAQPSATITVSVVTDASGTYRFPANKLKPGQYFLAVRATGYDLDGNGAATVAAGHAATADLKLKPTHDLASQLTNAEWLASFPGTDQQKLPLLSCTGCHTLQRIARATHDENEWVATIKRMASYAQESSPLKPQKTQDSFLGRTPPEVLQRLAAYLASIDLSAGPEWKYKLKVMPRVTGPGTRVVVTDYKLPQPTFEPHPRQQGPGLVLGFRRAAPRQSRPEDRQGHGISVAAAQRQRPCRRARYRAGRSARFDDGDDLASDLGTVRHQHQEIPLLSDSGGGQ
jgi:hypothetical protein